LQDAKAGDVARWISSLTLAVTVSGDFTAGIACDKREAFAQGSEATKQSSVCA
jgi:hypothetical protein